MDHGVDCRLYRITIDIAALPWVLRARRLLYPETHILRAAWREGMDVMFRRKPEMKIFEQYAGHRPREYTSEVQYSCRR